MITKYFHLSWGPLVINEDGETFTFTPRIPMYPYGYETGTFEDDFTPRVSLSFFNHGLFRCLTR